jgi:transcriptional antiterminator RfaH
VYWACAQLEPQRTGLALHCLGLNGFEVYCPKVREQRRVNGRKIERTSLLFPSYCFVLIVTGWWQARWSPGVLKIVLDGPQPARVSDEIIAEIKRREGPDGLVRLPKQPLNGLKRGQRVKILRGPFEGRDGLYDGMTGHERERVLLDLLGRHVPLVLPARDITAATF